MPDIFKPRAAGAPRIKWTILTTTALLPLALAAEVAAQTAQECTDGTTGPGDQDGTGNAVCETDASAYGQFNLASGTFSSAFGYSNIASGNGSSAFGRLNTADADGSSAIGFVNTASGGEASAVGRANTASGAVSSAFGAGNTAFDNNANAFGFSNTASGLASSAFGYQNTANGLISVAFGAFNTADADASSAIGYLNTASGDNSSAFGYRSTTGADAQGALAVGGWYDRNGNDTINAATELTFALGRYSAAVGTGVRAVEDFSSAFGVGSIASAEGATAIGFEAVADRAYTVAIGSSGNERNLIHVADGVEDTDAVNLRQLNLALTTATDSLPIAHFNDPVFPRAAPNAGAIDALAVGWGADADGLASVALGTLARTENYGSIAIGFFSSATDWNTIALGNGSDASGDGAMALGAYSWSPGFSALSVGTHAMATGSQSIALGYLSEAAGNNTVAIGANSVADRNDTVSFGTSGNERQLVHVADGTDDTDAVNLRQLNAAMAGAGGGADLAPLATALGGGASFAGGVWGAPEYIVLGTSFNNVGGAIGALNTQVEENTTDIADLKAAGGGGTPGSGDPAQDARIAALEAQLAALQGALQDAMGELAALSQGNVTGGTTSDNTNLATGPGSEATGHGDTAFGAGASATGDPSTAVGFQAQASGQHSTAIGGNAEATGDLSVALGQAAVASGANSMALGQGASATFDNSIAIGQGVATTRDGQVAIGSASNTYTLAGINSSASRAAQTGMTYMVTSDAAGNLATMDIEPWFARIEGLEASVGQRDHRFRTQADGIAVSLALGGAQVIQPGQTFAVSANVGHFDGSNAVGFGAIGRAKENVFVNIGVGAGSRTGAVAGRAGVSWGW